MMAVMREYTEEEKADIFIIIDSEIQIPKRLPKGLAELTNRLEQLAKERNWRDYITAWEELDVDAKAYQLEGRISMDDLQALYRRYNLG